MAKTNRNFLTYSYSGKVGKQYSLRNRAGKSYITSLPKTRANPTLTASQTKVRKDFQRAMLYARTANENPALMAEYAAVRREGQTAMNVAFLDAVKGPELADLRTDGYKGEAGQKIEVEAMDNFRVNSVKFVLIAANGTQLEEGDAVKSGNGFQWIYTTQMANPSLPGTIIKVTATDLPNNLARLEAIL
jgi:hypothetical protein